MHAAPSTSETLNPNDSTEVGGPTTTGTQRQLSIGHRSRSGTVSGSQAGGTKGTGGENTLESAGSNQPESMDIGIADVISVHGDDDDGDGSDTNLAAMSSNNATRNEFAVTQKEAAEGEVEKGTQTSANKAAEALSIAGRDESFTVYNPLTQDPIKLLPLLDALRDVAPIPDDEFDKLQAQREMHLFEADNKASVVVHDVLGFNCHTEDGKHNGPALLEHTDDDHILYRAGRHITVASLSKRGERRVLPALTDKCLQVYAYSVSSDGKYIAISERRPDSNVVSLYRVDSGALVSTLATKYLASTPVVAMSISSNNRFLVTVTAAPEHKLLLWHLEDSQVVGMCENLSETPIDRIAFNGWDSSRIISTNATSIVHWTHQDRTMQPVSLLEDTSRHAVPLFPGAYNYNNMSQSPHQSSLILKNWESSFFRNPLPSPSSPNLRSLRSPRNTQNSGGAVHGGFVASLWYDEDGSVSLTSDGWLVASEENDRITYCQRIVLPPRAFRVGQSNAVSTDPVASPSRPQYDHHGSPLDFSISRGGQHSFLQPTESSFVGRDDVTEIFGGEGEQTLPEFTHLVFVSRGVIAGTLNGTFVLMDRTYDRNVFTQVATFCCGDGVSGKLLGMSVSPGELNFVASASDNSMYAVGLGALDDAIHEAKMDRAYQAARARKDDDDPIALNMTTNSLLVDTFSGSMGATLTPMALRRQQSAQTPRGGGTFNYFNNPNSVGSSVRQLHSEWPEDCMDLCDGPKWKDLFRIVDNISLHSKPISSVSLCLQRPIIATTSYDHSVHVYNFLTHELIASITLTDPVNCATLNPMGTHIIIAEDFATNLYAILEQTITLIAPLPIRGVLGARYSVNGGKIAFSVGSRVHLFSAASFTPLGMLVGHTNMIKSMRWCQDDQFLVTSDVVGSIMKWSTNKFKREASECNHRGIAAMCAVCPNGSETFAAVGATRHAKGATLFDGEMTIVASRVVEGETPHTVYLRPGFQYPQSSRKMHTSPIAFATLSQTLFVGTPVGKVLLYSWPIHSFSRPYTILESHNDEVLHIEVSTDERNLFTVGTGGVMFIYDLTHIKGGRYMKVKTFDFEIFSQVFLTDSRSRVVVEDAAANDEAKDRIAFVKSEMAATEATLQAAHDRKIARLTAKTDKVCNQISKEIKEMNAKVHQTVTKGRADGSKQDFVRSDVLEEIETSYGRLTLEAAQRYEALHGEKEALVLQFEKAHAVRVAKWDQERSFIDIKRIEREKELSHRVEELRGTLKDQEQVRTAVLDLTLLDGEQEITALKRGHKNQLNYLAENIQTVHQLQVSGEREAMRLEQDIQALQDDLKEKEVILERIDKACEAQRGDNANLRLLNKTKQEEINATEKRMQLLRQQLLSLENLRFVLTHQLEDLQGEVEPKEAKLVQLDKAVLEREKMLQAVYGSRTRLVRKSEEAETALKQGVKSYEQTINTHNHKNYDIKSILADLTRAITMHAGNGTDLKRYLHAMVLGNQKRLPPQLDRNKNDTHAIEAIEVERRRVEDEIKGHNAFLAEILKAEQKIDKSSNQVVVGSNLRLQQANMGMIEEIKSLQQTAKQESQRLRNLERKLRDARVALQHMGDERRYLLNEERKSLAGGASSSSAAAQSRSDLPLAPPSLGATLSALSTHNRSKFTSPTSSVEVGGRKGTSSSMKRPASLPPLKPSGSMVVVNTPAGMGTSKPSSAGALGGGKMTVGKQRAQLESLIGQLDEGSEKMRSRQVEAHRLRLMVHELLSNEEKRLEIALSDTSEALAANTSSADRFVHLTSGDTPSILRMAAESRLSGATRTGMSMYTPGPQDYFDNSSMMMDTDDATPDIKGKVGARPYRPLPSTTTSHTHNNSNLDDNDDDDDASLLGALDPDMEVVPIPQLAHDDDGDTRGYDANTVRPMTPPSGLPQ